MSRKIAIFTGTRAEYGLLYWLITDIKADPDLQLQLIVSGTHLSPEFGLTYTEIEKNGFKIDEKIEILLSSDSAVGVTKSIGLGLLGYSDALARLKPDVIIILGDRFEALAAAQAAMFMRIPIVHLHGGEITEGAYDDSIRHAITKLSYLHGTSTEVYRQRVIQLGEEPHRVRNIGALGLDHLRRTPLLSLEELSASLNFPLVLPYFLVTYHPVTLADEPAEESFSTLLDVLSTFNGYQVIITYPNADEGGRKIIPLIEEYAKANAERVLSITSLGQLRYLSAVKYSTAVIGNSSSGVIEVPSFGVPTVNVGMRQKGRIAARSVFHCDLDAPSIEDAISSVIVGQEKGEFVDVINPYGSCDASGQVIDMIKNIDSKAPMKKFYDIANGNV